MIKLNNIRNVFAIGIGLLSASFMQAMNSGEAEYIHRSIIDLIDSELVKCDLMVGNNIFMNGSPSYEEKNISFLNGLNFNSHNKKYFSPEEREWHIEQARQAGYSNLSHPLLSMPNEIIQHVFSCCRAKGDDLVLVLEEVLKPILGESVSLLSQEVLNKIVVQKVDADPTKLINDSMKNLMKLSMVCKKFNALLSLKAIGNVCKNYAQTDKDETLEQFMRVMNDLTYRFIRVPLSILIHAGADLSIKPKCTLLLEEAALKQDEQLVKLLFEYKVNPNEICLDTPIFFHIKKANVLNKFLAQKDFNVHAVDRFGENVLFYTIIRDHYEAELVKFYLANGVDAKQFSSHSNSCLLHKLADYILPIINVNNQLEKAKLLLPVIPDMINALNKQGQTPLDIAYISLDKTIRCQMVSQELYKQLIALYREHGALTAVELKEQALLQRQLAQKNESHDCIICLDTQEQMLAIPCTNIHPQRICVECYNSLLAKSDKCPMCRNILTK